MININGTIINTPEELEQAKQGLSPEAQYMLDITFYGLAPVAPINERKDSLLTAIDRKTQDLIAEGFQFDGKTFSLSSNAQINWESIKANRDILAFPINITCNKYETYMLNYYDLDAFILCYFSTVQEHLCRGRELKQRVISASSHEELDQIIDTR